MKKRPNPDSEANIRRIDTKRTAKKQTHGFQVHLLRGAEAVSRLFSDTIYGGKEGARRAARKFKRSTLAEMPERALRVVAGSNSKGRVRKSARKSAAKRRKSRA